MSTTMKSMKKESERTLKKVTNEKEKFAVVPAELQKAIIRLLGQLPLEPYGQYALPMLQDLKKCPIVEKEDKQPKKEEGKKDD
jgi:hypothetical protein